MLFPVLNETWEWGLRDFLNSGKNLIKSHAQCEKGLGMDLNKIICDKNVSVALLNVTPVTKQSAKK